MKKIVLTILLSATLISSFNFRSGSISEFEQISSFGSRPLENQINAAIDNGNSTDSVITPTATPLLPTIPDRSDKTTCFEDAEAIQFGCSYGEFFQSDSDHDYYVYYAEYTNYFRFNVDYLNTSYYDCYIKIYKNNYSGRPIYSYTNADTKNGSDVDYNIEPIYAYQGDVFYFDIYQYIPPDEVPVVTYQTIYAGYTAKIISANETDCDPSEYEKNGYIISQNCVYNGSSTIYCYFETSLYDNIASDYSYADAVVEAMNMWNTVGIKQFVVADSEDDADVVLYTKFENNDYYTGRTTPLSSDKNNIYKNEVKFNRYFFGMVYNNTSKSECLARLLKSALHELGHCLGMDHLDYSESNIMYPTTTQLNKFGRGDIALYRYLWG